MVHLGWIVKVILLHVSPVCIKQSLPVETDEFAIGGPLQVTANLAVLVVGLAGCVPVLMPLKVLA